MEYNADLFASVKNISPDTRYQFELKGAFYYVFSNGEGDYHMSKDDRESLQERIYFYNHYISKDKYPIYSSKYGLVKDSVLSSQIFKQVLGLPLEVMIKTRKGEGPILLSGEEILSRIHFEDDLEHSYPKPDLDMMILNSNQPCVIQAINDLVAHGFYCLNPERIYDLNSLDEGEYFPFFIDVKKVESFFPEEVFSSHKLIMDFVADPFLITKEVYLNYFEPLNHKTKEELVKIAFDRNDLSALTSGEKEMRLALRRYFLALVRTTLNNFFMKKYHERGLFGFTVLNHDFEAINFQYRMIYQGLHYDMYAKEYRLFSREGDVIKQTYHPSHYVLDIDDKRKIIRAYNTIKHYFLNHRQYAFIPSLFLKMMGLPYPAFEMMKYFDYEHGDAKSFISKFEFVENIAYKKNGLLLTLMLEHGSQLSLKYWPSPIPHYLKHLERLGLYVSDIFAFSEQTLPNFILSYEGSNKTIQSLLHGDYNFYEEAFESLNHQLNNNPNVLHFDQVKDFLVRDQYNGKLISVDMFFSLMQDGLDAFEALDKIKRERKIDTFVLRVLINIGFAFAYGKKANKQIDRLMMEGQERLFYNLTQGEYFYDPYLEYPHVYKGRNFYAYSKNNKDFYFDIKDKKAIENLLLIYDLYFYGEISFPYVLQVFGRELHQEYTKIERESIRRLKFLGLPGIVNQQINIDDDILPQLHFEENISIYDNINHRELLQKDYSLHYPLIFREVVCKGLYLNGRLTYPTAIYPIEPRLDETLKYYLSEDFILTQLTGLAYNGKLPEQASSVSNLTRVNINRDFFRFLYGSSSVIYYEENSQPFGQLAIEYGGRLMHALYQVCYHDLFQNENYHHYLLSYKQDDIYISLGHNFYAYSQKNEISSFGLLEEDVEPLLETYQHVSQAFKQIKNKQNRAMLITYHLGLPVALVNLILGKIIENNFVLTKEDIPVFIPGNAIIPKFSYDDPLCMHSPKNMDWFYSTQLFNQALRKGFFVYPDSKIIYSSLLNPKQMAEDLPGTADLISTQFVSVLSHQEDVVKSLMHPNEIVFNFMVKDFIQSYDEITNIYSDLLFYVQELLIYGYYKDKDFIVKAINRLQNGHADEYIRYLKRMFKSFKLKEFTTKYSLEVIYRFLAFFFIYIQQQVLFRISKKIRMSDK